MRIISGKFKGRILEPIKTKEIRPTSDRVKEALFSIINEKIEGSLFLDLFAGSGSVGIEAYSRGAKEVVFVDLGSDSIKVLKNNLSKMNITQGIEVYNMNYENALNKLGKRSKKFDIIFIDPPYNESIPINAAELIYENNILNNHGIIIIEHDIKVDFPEKISTYKLLKRKKYGNTQLSLYFT